MPSAYLFSGKPVLCSWRPLSLSGIPRRNLAAGFCAGRPLSSRAAEDKTEEPLRSISSGSEAVQGIVLGGSWPGKPSPAGVLAREGVFQRQEQ